jgi:catechol 2,3-dioxygenase-like lactoylglutathione lyase family enzyme
MPPTEQAGRIPLSMSHIGLYVHDLPRMEDFYTRVLGFTVTARCAGPTLCSRVGIRRTITRWRW